MESKEELPVVPTPVVPEEKLPCDSTDTECTRRWVDSLSDCV